MIAKGETLNILASLKNLQSRGVLCYINSMVNPTPGPVGIIQPFQCLHLTRA